MVLYIKGKQSTCFLAEHVIVRSGYERLVDQPRWTIHRDICTYYRMKITLQAACQIQRQLSETGIELSTIKTKDLDI